MTLEVTELVGSADIAEKTGAHRSAPGVWERRYLDFPNRVATINQTKDNRGVGVWNWRDVEAWCRLTGRLPLEKGRIYDEKTGRDITDRALKRKRISA